jgi:hypothetical protein
VVAVNRRWLALAALVAGCLACNLTGYQRPTPTVTLMAASPPAALTADLVLPTATLGPTATPLGGQFAPTSTLKPTPTQLPLPSPLPPAEFLTVTATETTTPASPLEITLIEFTDWREVDAEGHVGWTLVVHVSGGDGVYTYLHEDQVQRGPIFEVIGTQGSAFVHTVSVRSGDGQEARCSYYVPSEERDYFRATCGD